MQMLATIKQDIQQRRDFLSENQKNSTGMISRDIYLIYSYTLPTRYHLLFVLIILFLYFITFHFLIYCIRGNH